MVHASVAIQWTKLLQCANHDPQNVFLPCYLVHLWPGLFSELYSFEQNHDDDNDDAKSSLYVQILLQLNDVS